MDFVASSSFLLIENKDEKSMLIMEQTIKPLNSIFVFSPIHILFFKKILLYE